MALSGSASKARDPRVRQRGSAHLLSPRLLAQLHRWRGRLVCDYDRGRDPLTAIGYWRGREDDPGLTTEIALIGTTLLGGLSIQNPALAASLAVIVACLLAARSGLHRFVRFAITEDELKDALIFAGATLVVLPLIPDRPMGPYGALNPHSIWILVILVMAIGAAGHFQALMHR